MSPNHVRAQAAPCRQSAHVTSARGQFHNGSLPPGGPVEVPVQFMHHDVGDEAVQKDKLPNPALRRRQHQHCWQCGSWNHFIAVCFTC